MRLYAVDREGSFVEYTAQDFGADQHERVLEDWLEHNPNALLEDSNVLLIGRQVSTEWGSTMDLLGLDKDGNVVVVELKRGRTPREVLAQALEYAAFVSALDYTALNELYCQYQSEVERPLGEAWAEAFDAEAGTGVAFNKEQRVVIVAEDVTPPLRATASYLRRIGLPMTCVEFGFFRTKGGDRVLSTDIVVGEEAGKPKAASQPKRPTTRADFERACDEVGRMVHGAILRMAEEEGFPVNWGTAGYSMRVEVAGRQATLCLGSPQTATVEQALGLYFSEAARKVRAVTEIQARYGSRFRETGLFEEMGGLGNLKWVIDKPVSDETLSQVIGLLRDLGREVREAWRREMEDGS